MAVDKIEALVDAIGKIKGVGDPSSDAYKLRNPLLIKSFAKPGKHETDDQGRRVFSSWLSGYKAAGFDCQLKLSGNSRAGLKPTDTLVNILGVYGVKELGGIKAVVLFLRKALEDVSISKDVSLQYFLDAAPTTEKI
jgi:hypothetical protein